MDDFDKTLYEIIKQSGFVKPEQLDDAYQSSRELQKLLFDILIFRGLCSEQVIGQLIANNLKTPFVSLANTTVADEILHSEKRIGYPPGIRVRFGTRAAADRRNTQRYYYFTELSAAGRCCADQG